MSPPRPPPPLHLTNQRTTLPTPTPTPCVPRCPPLQCPRHRHRRHHSPPRRRPRHRRPAQHVMQTAPSTPHSPGPHQPGTFQQHIIHHRARPRSVSYLALSHARHGDGSRRHTPSASRASPRPRQRHHEQSHNVLDRRVPCRQPVPYRSATTYVSVLCLVSASSLYHPPVYISLDSTAVECLRIFTRLQL